MFFFLPKDPYVMFLASLVQDYYPVTFLITMLSAEMGLMVADSLQGFCNCISEAEVESDGTFLLPFDFIIPVAFAATVTL